MLGVYFLSDRLITQKNVVLQTSSMLRVRFALNSVLDYMYYNVQRRNCMDENLLAAADCQLGSSKGKVQADTTAELANGKARSLERVLLSDNLARNVQLMVDLNCVDLKLEKNLAPAAPQGNCTAARMGTVTVHPDHTKTVTDAHDLITKTVTSMEIVVPAANIGQTHPLHSVIDPVYHALNDELIDKSDKTRLKKLDFNVHVIVTRDTNVPVSGTEVYFTVKVSFEDLHGKLLVANQVPLTVMSYGTIYSREVGTFALMMTKDLYLDGLTAGGAPNTAVPTVATAFTNPQAGLNFLSPVFINGNLHLPSPGIGGKHYSSTSKFSPVTFSDRIVLGSGWIYDGGPGTGKLYRPDTAGGKHDMFWADNRMLGGIKMGALIDNMWDQGLTQYGEFNIGAVDDAKMRQCLQFNKTKNYSATETPFTQLYAAQQGSAMDWVLGLANFQSGSSNWSAFTSDSKFSQEFVPKSTALSDVIPSGLLDASAAPLRRFATISGTVTDISTGTTVGGGVMQVKVGLSSSTNLQSATAEMPMNSKLVIKPAIGGITDPALAAAIGSATATTLPVGSPAWLQTLASASDLTAFTNAQTAIKEGAQIIIEILPLEYETNEGTPTPFPGFPVPALEKHLAEVKVSLKKGDGTTDLPASRLLDGAGVAVAPSIEFTAFDGSPPISTTQAGITRPPFNSMIRSLIFQNSGASFVVPAHLTDPDGSEVTHPFDALLINGKNYDGGKYLNFFFDCERNASRATGQSFGAAAWNVNFSPDQASVRKSWNNAGPSGAQSSTTGEMVCNSDGSSSPVDTDHPHIGEKHYAACDLQFDFSPSSLSGDSRAAGTPEYPGKLLPTDAPSGFPAGRDKFKTMSVVKDCSINSGAQLVAGMFTCDTLTIRERTSALYIIGTFIVRELVLDGDAKKTLGAGIHWMSIYHPDALGILRASGILHKDRSPPAVGSDDCPDVFTSLPMWDTSGMGLPTQQAIKKCNVLSLRAVNDNFRWTAVDPDCGVVSGQTNTTCKLHPINFLVTEHGRGGGP